MFERFYQKNGNYVFERLKKDGDSWYIMEFRCPVRGGEWTETKPRKIPDLNAGRYIGTHSRKENFKHWGA